MATSHSPEPATDAPKSPRSPLVRQFLRGVAAAGLVALAAGVFAPGVAQATPETKLAVVKKKVDALNEQEGKLTEQYDQARIQLKAAKRTSKQVHARSKVLTAKVAKLRRGISAIASSAYMGGMTSVASLSAASSPQEFVDKATSLQQLSGQNDAKMADFKHASASLATQRTAAAKALAAKKKIAAGIDDKRDSIRATLAKQRRLLDQLDAANASTDTRATRGQNRPTPPGNLPPASGRAAAAVNYAKMQLGKPYVWGAAGPSSFDCSGLTMMAWKAAGVSLPHSSSAQYGSGAHPSQSQLQPGDLVFFYSPIHHVGLYVGGGQMIHAPHTGDVVRYASVASNGNYVGAARPG